MAKPKKINLNDNANEWSGTSKADRVFGNGGDDVLSGGKGNDKLDGGDGNDILRGGAGDDKLIGGLGDDLMFGGAGDDIITTGVGNDTIDGGAGDDVVKFAGNFADATVVVDGEYFAITLGGFTTKIKNVELFKFADGTKTVEQIAEAANPVVPSTELTAGLDNLVGTAGDDIFNATTGTGFQQTTLNAFDTIDGGDGKDTLNIYVDGTSGIGGAPANIVQQGTIKNIETINIYNDAFSGDYHQDANGNLDVSKFAGAEQVWQIGLAGAVVNASETVTAGFRNVDQAISVSAAETATGVNVALDKVVNTGSSDVAVSVVAATAENKSLASLTITGNVLDGNKADTETAGIDLDFWVGAGVKAVTLTTAIDTDIVGLGNNFGANVIESLDASASTGAINYVGGLDTIATLKTGSGNDVVELLTKTSATVTAASVSTGDGNDTITVNTSGTGTTTIDAGAGGDTVALDARSTGKLTLNLGDGNDSFTTKVGINGTDSIDGGAGIDTLQLNIVGAANIGAFSNFEVFDAKDLAVTLDIAILASKNTVTELVTSGAVGAGATLTNIGAGVGFRATGDMGASSITLTQAAAGALAITLDADEKAPAAAGNDAYTLSAVATNASSLTATFASDFLDKSTGAGDNVGTINLKGDAATSLTVASDGANASLNVLNYVDGAATDALTTITVTGATALELNVDNAGKLATIDASTSTGGLTFEFADFSKAGTIKLGSGVDTLTVTAADYANGMDKVVGFEKAAAVAGSAAPADAAAAAAAQADADSFIFAGATVADANAGVLTGTITDGVLTFTGAGPTTLADAIGIADLAADGAGEALVFQYLGNSYAFVQGGANDIVVELEGVTGVTKLLEIGATDEFFII